MINLSEHNFVAPYKFIGDEALSVDNAITSFTLLSKAALIMFSCANNICFDKFKWIVFCCWNLF